MPKERVLHAILHATHCTILTANDITKATLSQIYMKSYRRHNFELWHYNKLASLSGGFVYMV